MFKGPIALAGDLDGELFLAANNAGNGTEAVIMAQSAAEQLIQVWRDSITRAHVPVADVHRARLLSPKSQEVSKAEPAGIGTEIAAWRGKAISRGLIC
jgi:hypothetical protein